MMEAINKITETSNEVVGIIKTIEYIAAQATTLEELVNRFDFTDEHKSASQNPENEAETEA